MDESDYTTFQVEPFRVLSNGIIDLTENLCIFKFYALLVQGFIRTNYVGVIS